MSAPPPTLVLHERDDLMHENTGEPTFNESAYFNFYDVAARIGGFVRIGNRPNEGHAEVTVCLYLPAGDDGPGASGPARGPVAFMFARPRITANDGFAAAGLRFEVLEPLAKHQIVYDGMCCVLREPLELLDPRRALAENPHVPVQLDLRYQRCAPPFGGEPREPPQGAAEFFRGHFEQHGRATGLIVVDGAERRVDGFGLRDRSWGPRSWQAFERYRWLTMSFGADAGIAAARITQRDGRELHGGHIYRAGEPNQALERVEIETRYERGLHAQLTATVHPIGGPPERIEGRVLQIVPLRNRRDGLTTRIAEGLTEWRWGERLGYGWSEYLDHTGAATAGSASR